MQISFLINTFVKIKNIMRLTVHVREAKKTTEEKKVKDGVKIIKKTINTYSFDNVQPNDVPRILQNLEDDGFGIPTKHYFSQDKRTGQASGKKKKA